MVANDTITPTNSIYAVQFAGITTASYSFVGSSSFNLNTYPPVTTFPVPSGPVPTVFLTSNNVFTGSNTFNGPLSFSSISFVNFTTTGAFTSSGTASFVTLSASGQITSTLATGTAPFVIASTTVVPNLNAALLNGTTWAAPGAIGGTTPAVGNFTTLTTTGKITTYNNIATVSNGVPAEYAHVNLASQNAAISATTLYAVPSTGVGMYRISWVAKVTTPSDKTSILGGATGFQILYTDSDDSVAVTTATQPPAFIDTPSVAAKPTAYGNTTQTRLGGVIIVNAKASTNIQYQFGYTDTHTSTQMAFSIHIKLESL